MKNYEIPRKYQSLIVFQKGSVCSMPKEILIVWKNGFS